MAVTMVVIVATDLDNQLLAGAKLYAYAAGTTTPRAMYTDSGLGTATANPLICDSSGRGVAWLDSSLGDYKLVLKDSGDAATYYSQDNITVGDNPQIIVYPAGVGDQSLNVADSPSFAGLSLTGNLDLNGNDLIIDADADSYLHANADDDIRLVVAGTDELTFNTTGLIPTTDDGYQLGGTSNRFSNIYASAANIDGDITVTGTVDGRDISADGDSLDALIGVVGIGDLTGAEVDQLENIDSVTISNSQWGYLGGAAAFGGSIMASASAAAARGLLEVVDQSVTFASQAEAEAGTDNTKSMNPLRTAQAIAALAPVLTVAGKSGAVTLDKNDVGLGNVDNTSDLNKPVSTAAQSALDLKANLASPALTGNPTAPTQSAGDNSTKIATTAYADSAGVSVASDGMIARTSATTYAARTITAGTGLSVADGDGVSGDPTISIADSELLAIAALSSAVNTIIQFTGAGTAQTVPFLVGTYSPSATSVANLDSVAAAGSAIYIRMFNYVLVFGLVTIDPTAASDTTTTFRMSLPIASNFSSAANCIGLFNSASAQRGGRIQGSVANDEAEFTFASEITVSTNYPYAYIYQVI